MQLHRFLSLVLTFSLTFCFSMPVQALRSLTVRESASLEPLTESLGTWASPIAVDTVGSVSSAGIGLEEQRFETSADRLELPVDSRANDDFTFAIKPGEVALVQWASDVPGESNSQFVLVRSNGDTIDVLEAAQFDRSNYHAGGGSQAFSGLRVPGNVATTWAGMQTDATVEIPSVITLTAGNGSVTGQLPQDQNVIVHKLSGLEEFSAVNLVGQVQERNGVTVELEPIASALNQAGVPFERLGLVQQTLTTQQAALEREYVGEPESLIDATAEGASSQRAALIGQGMSAEILETLGVVIMAGGAGTRLLIDLAKTGLFPDDLLRRMTKPTTQLSPVAGKSALAIQLEAIQFLNNAYGVNIPVLIVTSDATHDEIDAFVGEQDRYGMGGNLRLAKQPMMPSVDADGKIILKDDGMPAMNPNGTGGVWKALKDDGHLDWFKSGGQVKKLLVGNGDMALLPEMFATVAAAAQDHKFLSIAYGVPRMGPSGETPLGTLHVMTVNGERRLGIAERSDRDGNIAGFRDGFDTQETVYGNSGLYAADLADLDTRLDDLQLQVPTGSIGNATVDAQGGPDATNIKGVKPEYFAPHLLFAYEPAEIGVLAVDQKDANPVKNPAKWTEIHADFVTLAASSAQALRIDVPEGARVEFDFEFSRSATVGTNVKVREGTAVHFANDGVYVGPVNLERPDVASLQKVLDGIEIPNDTEFYAGMSGLEEEFEVVDAAGNAVYSIPASGIMVDGYFDANGTLLPDALLSTQAFEPGQQRLLVPPAVMDGSQHVYVQMGLLSNTVIDALRAQGVAVSEFLLQDIPEPAAVEGNVYIAAVPHDSGNESRMAGYGTLVNLYGSTPETRPTTLSALATLVQVATRTGMLRVNAIYVDDVSGVLAIDLYA